MGTVNAFGDRLTFSGEVFINPSATRQWVSVKLFALSDDLDDRSALTAMIAHVRYRDSYAGTGDRDMVTSTAPTS
ncbi:hypothetical protein [Mycolicibacterium arenosum]|uniref:Uncharacterized protein n=1 Tax=Mycolicibacterium arenosum TaxID=2952157 RepID=A0ABT1MC97_9MYCO|nr:hypothetical protein [Mycolicibacterium sp. CAU 1645]MCP9276793.1 hypothetical protein [Mycolicibacterium sp. CAU 1645]